MNMNIPISFTPISSSKLNRIKWLWNASLTFLGSWNIAQKTSVKTLIRLKKKLWRLQILLAILLISYAFYFLKESKSKKGRLKTKFYVFRFLEKWACIIIISILFLFCDICVNMTHVSNRFKFNTFFTLILSFENGISNEWTSLPQKEKKVVTWSTKTLSNDCDMIHSQSQQYINNTLQKQLFADVLQNCWCSQRCS